MRQSLFFVISKRLIELDVFSCGASPAVVAFEGSGDESAPVLLVIISREGAVDRVEHIVCVVALKGEAVALAVAAVGDGILEAAGLPDDGDRAVAQRHHL